MFFKPYMQNLYNRLRGTSKILPYEETKEEKERIDICNKTLNDHFKTKDKEYVVAGDIEAYDLMSQTVAALETLGEKGGDYILIKDTKYALDRLIERLELLEKRYGR